MLGLAYMPPQPATPERHPCLDCRIHGPYCADACVTLDVWREAQQAKQPGKGQQHGREAISSR